MSRAHIHVERLVIDAPDASPVELRAALAGELTRLFQREPVQGLGDAAIPSLRVEAPAGQGAGALARHAARAIHGGVKP